MGYIKGVSDLEICMDYFALTGISCKSLNRQAAEKNLANFQKPCRLTALSSQFF